MTESEFDLWAKAVGASLLLAKLEEDRRRTMKRRRFQFVPFWRLTNRGWLPEYFGKVLRWGDETYRNRTVIVPFVGEFIWWDKNPCDDPTCDCRMKDGPPKVEYPEDHSPFCPKDCDHPCHDPYDAWVARKNDGEGAR